MKFTTKFSLLFIAITTMAMGSILVYSQRYFSTFFEKEATDNFRMIAETSEGAYYAFITTLRTRTVDWSSDGYIRTMVQALLALPEGKERTALEQQLTNYFTHKKLPYDPAISIVDILDNNGIIIASSRENRIGINEKKEEEEFHSHRFREAIVSLSPQAFVSNMILEKDEGMEPMIHVTSRLFSQDEKTGQFVPVNAVMLLHFININELGAILTGAQQIAEGAPSGRALFQHYKTAEMYLVNQDRLLITPSRFVSDAVMKLTINTDPVKACLDEGREISGSYLNYRGIPVIGASMCLKRDNTVLIAEVEQSEIITPLEQFQSRFLAGSIAVIVASMVGIYVVSARLLRNLEHISAAAKKISAGDFTARTAVTSRDEIGMVAHTFDMMIENITQSEEELKKAETELKGMNLTLEKRVKERTAELEEMRTALEKSVAERTVELQQKVDELEKFKKLTVGRELKMMELKKEIEHHDPLHHTTP